ncbi:hypothetical protein [Rhizobium sp. BK251]|uniref:hypothetical protein n=1 Tax=Rhizobium sp. BK251 TaxID=2512125 RepID=UPI00104A93A0|nr:hypothetical protein [Rhizobium sp. BK251]
MLAVSSFCFIAAPAAEADNLLIWSPAKVSPNTYQATVGFRLPMTWETSAGADLGLGATRAGALLPDAERATLWGKLADENVTPASRARQEVAVRVDTLRGSGTLLLSRSRNFIFSENLDMELSRALSVGYAKADTRPASLDVSQAIKLIYPWTGTALSARGAVTDTRGDFSTTLAISQNILPNLDLSASLTDPISSGKTGDVRLRYQVRW